MGACSDIFRSFVFFFLRALCNLKKFETIYCNSEFLQLVRKDFQLSDVSGFLLILLSDR